MTVAEPRRDEDAPAPRAPRSNEPIGATAAFHRDVAASPALGPGFAKAWLSSVTCQFTDDIVWTSDDGVAVLTRACEALVAKHGVVIKADAASREHFRAQTARFAK